MSVVQLIRPSATVHPDTAADIEPVGFDAAGDYNQDGVNGLTDDVINSMLTSADLKPGLRILDCMAGNGNLSERIIAHYQSRQWDTPNLTVLEYSQVQAGFAEVSLADHDVNVIWGDALTMEDLDTHERIPDESFDRIFIKSANHEIPQGKQIQLYSEIFRILKPGGIFVNLGMLFESEGSRDDVAGAARVKDYYAGMHANIVNRHFLTKQEFYHALGKANFNDISIGNTFDYHIQSSIVANQYFNDSIRRQGAITFQAELLFCRELRAEGRITMEGENITMHCPGEVTVAKKSSAQDDNESLFAKYPYHFLRKISVHRDLLNDTKAHLPNHARVLDLACGMGLLAERIANDVDAYRGIDFNRDFVAMCQSDLGDHDNVEFMEGDIHALKGHTDFNPNTITILNALYIAGMKPNRIMRQIKKLLAPGGTLIISGPVSQKAFERTLPHIVEQLKQDGEYDQDAVNAIAQANASLLTADCNYWSAEGMVALLMQHGFQIVEASMDYYHGNCFKVVATH